VPSCSSGVEGLRTRFAQRAAIATPPSAILFKLLLQSRILEGATQTSISAVRLQSELKLFSVPLLPLKGRGCSTASQPDLLREQLPGRVFHQLDQRLPLHVLGPLLPAGHSTQAFLLRDTTELIQTINLTLRSRLRKSMELRVVRCMQQQEFS
jgi:hypothetical protein